MLQRTGSFKFQRRLQQDLAQIPEDRRAGGVVACSFRQSCARRRRGGEAARHAGGDRDAEGCAEGEAQSHCGARRRGDPVRPRPPKTAPPSPRKSRMNAARPWCRLYDDPDDHRRAGHDRPRDRFEDLTALGWLGPDVVVGLAHGGSLAAGVAAGHSLGRCYWREGVLHRRARGLRRYVPLIPQQQPARRKTPGSAAPYCDALMTQTPGELSIRSPTN